jgi:hypothetical protein
LQKITAQHINLSPILVCATGRAGGGRSKTMEAGYILCELDLCEGRFYRVLAVVPARLVTKWKKEMRNRFEEPFDGIKESRDDCADGGVVDSKLQD